MDLDLDLDWARLDKKNERARARHEFARLGMGTNFLVYDFIIIIVVAF